MGVQHWCHFGHPCLRAVLVTRAIPSVQEVEYNYDTIISYGPSTRVLGTYYPCSRAVDTAREHG